MCIRDRAEQGDLQHISAVKLILWQRVEFIACIRVQAQFQVALGCHDSAFDVGHEVQNGVR